MVQTGRKWRAQECLEAWESQLKHKLFVFMVTSGQAKDKCHQRREEQRDGGHAAPGYMDMVGACSAEEELVDRQNPKKIDSPAYPLCYESRTTC